MVLDDTKNNLMLTGARGNSIHGIKNSVYKTHNRKLPKGGKRTQNIVKWGLLNEK